MTIEIILAILLLLLLITGLCLKLFSSEIYASSSEHSEHSWEELAACGPVGFSGSGEGGYEEVDHAEVGEGLLEVGSGSGLAPATGFIPLMRSDITQELLMMRGLALNRIVITECLRDENLRLFEI